MIKKLKVGFALIVMLICLNGLQLNEQAVVYGAKFPCIEFYYNDKVYKWDLTNTSNGVNNHNATFEMQKQFLETAKVGLEKSANSFKAKNLSDKEVLFNLLPNFETVYEKIAKEIESEFKESQIVFNPNSSQMFKFDNGNVGIKINDSALLKDVISGKEQIEIKVIETKPKFTKQELEQNCVKRSSQSTSFAGSESGRRFNLIKAMATFNGLVVMPNEIVSFNDILEKRDNGESYKEATVIVNGEFTKGIGGGICQASTTIYNAVLMAGLEILEVHRHTLPVGYVEKGFDAMVNDGGIDMRFKNNTNMPIYIKTYQKCESVYAEVYGKPLNNIWYKKVSEKVRDIEPPEAKIIPDIEGKYISRIKYKGEFYTEKYAKNGYEVKGYLYTYKGDEVVSIKLVRHEKYASTQAVIYEGVEEPPLVKDLDDDKQEKKKDVKDKGKKKEKVKEAKRS
ncbi:MAG: VanW family protein [Clostridia bacterium]|nr:VanW family protein [Clostridia bacterium]